MIRSVSGIDFYEKLLRILESRGVRKLPTWTPQQCALEADHVFRCEVVAGFWLDVNWLLAWPLPSDHECLQRMLA